MTSKSGYTVFWSNGQAEDFWATDDYSALADAMAMSVSRGDRIFRLSRTGFDRMELREVANVTNKI